MVDLCIVHCCQPRRLQVVCVCETCECTHREHHISLTILQQQVYVNCLYCVTTLAEARSFTQTSLHYVSLAGTMRLLVGVAARTASWDRIAWHSLVVCFAAGDDLASTGV